MLKKILYVLICIIILLNINCFADDISENSNIDKNIIDESIEAVSKNTALPIINSRAAIVIDRNSKEILYGKNENQKKAMASTTKIMTALITIENSNLNDIVEISKKAATIGGSKLKLKAGDKISINDLLYGLMLKSGNDAAVALAEYVGGSIENFANLMNSKKESLNLHNTNFVTPHGLDMNEHYTTAYELSIITDYALKNDIFCKIVNTKTYTLKINDQTRTISNTNELLGNLNGVYGVKTGFTNGAGRCLVTAIKRNNLDIICVVLGADTKNYRTKDSVKLIEYTFNNFEIISLNNKINTFFSNWMNENICKINIEKGNNSILNLKLKDYEKEILYPIIKNTENNIDINILLNYNIKAPIEKEQQIGKLQIIYQNKIIKELSIVTENKINRRNVVNYITYFIKYYNNYLKSLTK